MSRYVLTQSNVYGLQDPKYFPTFGALVEAVIQTVRQDLIENDATYKAVVDFDESIATTRSWQDLTADDMFLVINDKKETIRAKTSTLTNYGLELIGELLPERKE